MGRPLDENVLVHCFRCEAWYRPGGWFRAERAHDTTGNVRLLGPIRAADCPICRKPPMTENPNVYVGPM
jgi:hypothetical protein